MIQVRILNVVAAGLSAGFLCGASSPSDPKAAAEFQAKPGDDLGAKIEEVRRTRPAGPVVLWLQGGTYRVTETIRLDRRDSNLTIAARPGERPVLDAGYAVKGFRPAGDGTFVADISGASFVDAKIRGYGGIGVLRDDGFTDDLYRDGVLQTLAREPNAGFFKVTEVVDGSNFVFRSAAVDAAKFADEKDLLALGYWRYLWGDETYPASVRDGAWALDHSNAEYRPVVKDAPFFLLNSRKFLDRDDEWVLDRAARKVYVKGEPKGEYVLAGLRGPLLQADGVNALTVSGLTFRHGRGTGVMVRNCCDFTFADNVVERFGFNGLDCQSATRARIVRNRFRTFGWKAALLGGGDRATLTPSGSEFADNDVSDTGRSRRTYSHGILISGCGVAVVRNRFHDLPSSAMCTPGNDHFIASNIIERVVLESDDQGGLDVFGNPFFRGTRIVHNVWRDIGGTSTGLAGTCGKAGVRFDDMISGMYVYGNRFDNCSEGIFGGVQIHAGRDNTIDNNVFTRCRHALSVTVWSKERWQRSWDANDPIRETVDTCGPAWLKRYGDLRWLRDYPITNRFTRNVVIGAQKLMRGQAEWETVKDGTRVFPADAKVDLDHLEGFDPLPPESELGPRGAGGAVSITREER